MRTPIRVCDALDLHFISRAKKTWHEWCHELQNYAVNVKKGVVADSVFTQESAKKTV